MKKGFTLLEILVVIGIIGILLGLGAVSYSTAQKKARDARRKGDLQAIQKVLEQCYSVNNYSYPSISGNGTTSVAVDCPIAGAPDLTITDPTTKTYTVSSATTSYTVSITLEETGSFSISNQQ